QGKVFFPFGQQLRRPLQHLVAVVRGEVLLAKGPFGRVHRPVHRFLVGFRHPGKHLARVFVVHLDVGAALFPPAPDETSKGRHITDDIGRHPLIGIDLSMHKRLPSPFDAALLSPPTVGRQTRGAVATRTCWRAAAPFWSAYGSGPETAGGARRAPDGTNGLSRAGFSCSPGPRRPLPARYRSAGEPRSSPGRRAGAPESPPGPPCPPGSACG